MARGPVWHIFYAGMRVHLRHAQLGLYYAGPKHWVSNPDSALDLETIERATELSRQEDFERKEIVASFGDPICEVVLPLAVKRSSPAQADTLSLTAPLVLGHSAPAQVAAAPTASASPK
jgi:hypothetical protein